MVFLRKYNYIIIILVFFVILYISYSSFNTTKEIIMSKHSTRKELVENIVISALANANGAYSISEKTLNKEMEDYSRMILEEYHVNPDIRTWNLYKLKDKIQAEDYDIYIIDQNLKIIKTTFETDLGMDFSKYESFAKLLRERFAGNDFVADKMDISTNTGEMKKYSYQPTPDHRYLIELSINIMERYPVLEELNIFSLANELVDKYQSVDNISFYKFNKEASVVGLIKDEKNPISTDIPEFDKALVRETILSNSIKSSIFKNGKITITQKYIPFMSKDNDDGSDWWNSYVVGITYNNKVMLEEINIITNSFLFNILIIALVFITFIAIMVYLLKKTEHMAYHDHLTGLANRKAFEKYFKGIIRRSDNKHAVIYIDLDNFKKINDNYGHALGDELLKQLGNRLKSIVRTRDKVSRIGGDEFIILLTDISSNRDILKIVEKLESCINKSFCIKDNTISINCSVGVSIYPDQGSSLSELINKADISMYHAKHAKS